MKVTVDRFGRRATVELACALEPHSDSGTDIAESAMNLAQENAEAIGRLLAHLVEKRKISFDDATVIARRYYDGHELHE